MILVGQYDSPYVRRVAVSLRILGLAYAHDTRSVFADFDAMREVNPLGRIPSLVLDGGEVVIDSAAIHQPGAGAPQVRQGSRSSMSTPSARASLAMASNIRRGIASLAARPSVRHKRPVKRLRSTSNARAVSRHTVQVRSDRFTRRCGCDNLQFVPIWRQAFAYLG